MAIKKDRLLEATSRNFGISKNEAETAEAYSLYYLLGILNSRLSTWYLKNLLGMAIEINPETGRRLPIYRINFIDSTEISAHNEIVRLVKEMLQLQIDKAGAVQNFDDHRFDIQKRIEQVDAEIDRRVYDLYRLTENVISIIEGK
jgi:adenine-specific DNA-methyltransferase